MGQKFSALLAESRVAMIAAECAARAVTDATVPLTKTSPASSASVEIEILVLLWPGFLICCVLFRIEALNSRLAALLHLRR